MYLCVLHGETHEGLIILGVSREKGSSGWNTRVDGRLPCIACFIPFKFNNIYLYLFRKQLCVCVCVCVCVYIKYMLYIETICTSTNLGPGLLSYLHPRPALSSEFLLYELNLGLPTTPIRCLRIIPGCIFSTLPLNHQGSICCEKKVKVTQSFPALCDPMDCIVHGILQARIL